MYQPTGIVHITGERDVGKTLAALTAYHPEETAYIYDDVKRPPILPDAFALHVDLVQEFGDLKLLQFHDKMLELFESLLHYKAIVFDTWSRVGLALRNYAMKNPAKFRELDTFSRMGSAKGGEMWNEAHRYESAVISTLANKADFLCLVTHVKDLYIGGAKSGLLKPDCGKSFDKVCNLRLWLKQNPDSGVPIALVLKRITKIEITPEGARPVNVLPRRLEPTIDDYTVWDVIRRYWQEPIGNREPEAHETPSKYELSILDGILTDDQKMIWQSELAELERVEKAQAFEKDEAYARFASVVKELVEPYENLPVPLQATQVYADLPPELAKEYNLDDVTGVLK